MIWRSVWRMESTGVIAEILFLVIAAILGSLGLYFSSPIVAWFAGVALFLLIYRLRYKRL